MWKNETKASAKMRQKQVEKLDGASRPRPAKRQTKLKTSEIQRRRLPKDALVNKDRQMSTEVYKSTEAQQQSTADLSLSPRRSNELQEGGWPCQKCILPISRKPTRRQSTETHWEFARGVYREVDQSSPTDKRKARRDAIYWDAHREVDREVSREVDRQSPPS